jgi:hypothetical protein
VTLLLSVTLSLISFQTVTGFHITDAIGYLRARPDKRDQHETPTLSAPKALSNGNGQLEQGIARITATLGGDHRSATD